jgi:hypothetical protein
VRMNDSSALEAYMRMDAATQRIKESLIVPDAVTAHMKQLQQVYESVFRKPYLQEAVERFSTLQETLRLPSAAAALGRVIS